MQYKTLNFVINNFLCNEKSLFYELIYNNDVDFNLKEEEYDIQKKHILN